MSPVFTRRPGSPRRRRATVVALTGLVAMAGVGCTRDEGGSGTTGTTTGTAPATAERFQDPAERLADAKAATVDYFQALAVNDYDKALGRSSGAAATVVRWATGVNNVDAARGSGYQIPTLPPPDLRLELDRLDVDPSGRWVGAGFLELGDRPGGIATTTSTASTGTRLPPRSTFFVVDLTFREQGGRMVLDDYRYDDVPYPVSELYVELDGAEESVDGVSARLTMSRRNLDGSVQYLVEHRGASGLRDARFLEPGRATTPGAPGQPVEDFADGPGADGLGDALLVRPGAFPGGAGTLRLVLERAAGSTTGTTVGTTAPRGPAAGEDDVTLDLVVPQPPELRPRPVNTIVEEIDDSTTTSSSSSTTSSSTTPQGGVTTTLLPTPTVSPTAPTSSVAPNTTLPTTTTTRPSTTTTAP